MIITTFYELIVSELEAIMKNNISDERLKAHKNIELNKSYALLVWFLKFYGQKDLYKSYITDGSDDKSCDIIFSNKNVQGEDIFYIIQSKYVQFDAAKKAEDAFPKIKKEELGSTLNDFSMLLSGERVTSKNENFNQKYELLKKHLENNGKAKFLFFTLAGTSRSVEESVQAFNKNYAPNVSLEVIDIERIRRDYIEFKYKEATTANPLEYNYNSEDSTIKLQMERFEGAKRDIFEFEGRAKAFTFLLKPKTVYELFKKYKFSLFFKNVRNPIHRSNYNAKIVETLLKEPDSFWYFNNGITAITNILPDVGVHAKNMTIEGLQIINGAQTVYSIFKAYEAATRVQQKAMDAYAKVSIRLIGSSNEAFNLQITRYTNMQNPMENRDFWANDDVQQRLQLESFQTNVWYEKRRDEFQLSEAQQKSLGINIVHNFDIALAYAAFHLQKPTYTSPQGSKDIFISKKEHKDGLYENIFNENTKFIDMYAALYVQSVLNEIIKYDGNPLLEVLFKLGKIVSIRLTMGISTIIMRKYFALTRPNPQGKPINLSLYLLEVSKTQKEASFVELKKILKYTTNLIIKIIENQNEEEFPKFWLKLVTNQAFYDAIAAKIEEDGIDVAAIQAIEL
jgi:AIPR protein